MFVPRVRTSFELEASLHLQTNVSSQVSDVPQCVRFTLEDRNDNRTI